MQSPTYLLAKRIENFILEDLYERAALPAWDSPDTFRQRPRLYLFREVTEIIYPTITAGFFNRIVEDMKTAGLIGTTHRGGEYIFLSKALRPIQTVCKAGFDSLSDDSEGVRTVRP